MSLGSRGGQVAACSRWGRFVKIQEVGWGSGGRESTGAAACAEFSNNPSAPDSDLSPLRHRPIPASPRASSVIQHSEKLDHPLENDAVLGIGELAAA